MNHYAVIPAKERSSRCLYKNWRPFLHGMNLVEYTADTIPKEFFEKVILTTDKQNPDTVEGVTTIHHRSHELATTKSPINDTMVAVINSYHLEKESYLWMMNPTSPFRTNDDFIIIREIIIQERAGSVISTTKVNPFVWTDLQPLFETKGLRKNTQDFKETWSVENGQFFVVNVGEFLKRNTWYTPTTKLLVQERHETLFDIDTEQDFIAAQKWGAMRK